MHMLCWREDGASEAGPSDGAPKLRVRITNAASGSVRLDTRFPLDFLPGLAAFVPQARACHGYRFCTCVRGNEHVC